jgi:Stage II sporulation protein E (SpoIIE)./GAF domain.
MLSYMDFNYSKQRDSIVENLRFKKKEIEILNLNREIQEQKAINWVLGEVIKSSSNLNSFIELMDTVTDMLMGVMGLDTCTIWVRSKNSFKYYSRSVYNKNAFISRSSSNLPEYLMRVKDIGVFDLNNSEHKFIRGKNVSSILVVPLDNFKNKTRIGVIIAEHNSKEYFTPSKIDFFYALAVQIAIASENVKLFEEQRRKSEDAIKAKNELLIENINCASVIQNSLLPDMTFIKNYTDDAFVIWKPRDIVGGDIYWFIPQKNGFYIAVIDCTGHGVSGAFMTIAVNQILNQIFKECETRSSAEILNRLNNAFKDTFYKFNDSEHFHAGLDIGICFVNKTLRKITYSGAHISLFHMNNGELKEIRGTNRSIGYNMKSKRNKKSKEFIEVEIDYIPGDALYMTTDGFIDQNGDKNIYPFGVDNFINALKDADKLPFEKQRNELLGTLIKYMGSEEQRDDITLFAIKLE